MTEKRNGTEVLGAWHVARAAFPRAGQCGLRSVLATCALVLLLLLVAGCGGEEQPAQTVTVTTPPEDRAAAPEEPPEPPSENCDDLGINQEEGNEGVCVEDDGTRLKVVDKDTRLTLPELDAELVSITTQDTISTDIGTEAADGTYVIVTLTITNKLSEPVIFEQDQVFLALGDRTFTPDFDAANIPGDSFVWNSDPIQPGNSRTGTVVFDVSDDAVPELETNGNLTLYQFSDLQNILDEAPPERTAGVFRTYQ
jgi:hypothetical protein